MLPEFTGSVAPWIRIGEKRPGQISVFTAPERVEVATKSEEPAPLPRKQPSQMMSVGRPPFAAAMNSCAFGPELQLTSRLTKRIRCPTDG